MSSTSTVALVISDIDGTLITTNHEVTASTKAAAAKLAENGIALALASSRPPRSIRPLAEALNLQSPFAAFNGALLVNASGTITSRSFLTTEIMARLSAIADSAQIGVWIYDETEWYAEKRDAFVEREEHTAGFEANLGEYQNALGRPAVKLTLVGQPERVAVANARVSAELASDVAASRSKPRFLDVTAFGMHKGSVVTRLATAYGVEPVRVAVIGDGPNDVVMFEQAGLSIAMGQAVDEVRLKASVATTSNDEEGWARGIEKYVLGISAE
jgi:hypothetical protein